MVEHGDASDVNGGDRARAVTRDCFVERDGVRIAARDHGGSGRDLVLVHGGGRSLADFNAVVPLLTEHARVVALDLRGHGHTDEVAAWTFADAVADLDAVCDAFDVATPVVAGHSLGGMVACAYAADRANVRGAVNIDGSGQTLPSRWPGLGREQALAMFAEQKAKEQLAEPAEPETGDDAWMRSQVESARRRVEEGGGDWSVWEERALRSFAPLEGGGWRRATRVRSLKAMLAAIEHVDMFEVYRRTAQPLLLILATREEPHPDAAMHGWMRSFREGMDLDYDELVRGRAGVRIERVDCGHMVPLDRPAWLAAAITEFMRSLG